MSVAVIGMVVIVVSVVCGARVVIDDLIARCCSKRLLWVFHVYCCSGQVDVMTGIGPHCVLWYAPSLSLSSGLLLLWLCVVMVVFAFVVDCGVVWCNCLVYGYS